MPSGFALLANAFEVAPWWPRAAPPSSRHPAFSPKTAPLVVSKQALRKGERARLGRTRRRPADGIRLLYRSPLGEFAPQKAKVLGFLCNSSEATGVRTRNPLTKYGRQTGAARRARVAPA